MNMVKYNKEPEIIKENQTGILELKSTVKEMEMETATETIHDTMAQAEERPQIRR